jgi:hypothetical protein
VALRFKFLPWDKGVVLLRFEAAFVAQGEERINLQVVQLSLLLSFVNVITLTPR